MNEGCETNQVLHPQRPVRNGHQPGALLPAAVAGHGRADLRHRRASLLAGNEQPVLAERYQPQPSGRNEDPSIAPHYMHGAQLDDMSTPLTMYRALSHSRASCMPLCRRSKMILCSELSNPWNSSPPPRLG